MKRRKTDWTRTGTVAGYAKYLRKSSGALAVLVLRRDDSVLSLDEAIRAADFIGVLGEHLDGLVADAEKARREKRAARFNPPPLRE